MGNTQLPNANEGSELKGWEIKKKFSNMNIWGKIGEPKIEIQEYPLYLNDEKQFQRQRYLYNLRKQSKWLVAASFFTQQKQDEFCSSVYKGSLYLERIPLRLENVRDIPFPDILHLYNQALNGFELLSKQTGFFYITQQNIGISREGIVKVWLNKDFEKSYPSERQCSESTMVRNIVEVIQANTDPDTIKNKSILNYLYSHRSSINFNEAIHNLNEYINKFNRGQIPPKLQCVKTAGGTQALMNQYRINQDRTSHKIENQSKNKNFRMSMSPPQSSPPHNPYQNPSFYQQNSLSVAKNNFYKDSANNNLQKNEITPLVQFIPTDNNRQNAPIQQNISTINQPSSQLQAVISYQSNPSYHHTRSHIHSHIQPSFQKQIPAHLSNTSAYNLRGQSFHQSQQDSITNRIRANPQTQVIQNSPALLKSQIRQIETHQMIKPQSIQAIKIENMADYTLKPNSPQAPPAEVATGVPIRRHQKNMIKNNEIPRIMNNNRRPTNISQSNAKQQQYKAHSISTHSPNTQPLPFINKSQNISLSAQKLQTARTFKHQQNKTTFPTHQTQRQPQGHQAIPWQPQAVHQSNQKYIIPNKQQQQQQIQKKQQQQPQQQIYHPLQYQEQYQRHQQLQTQRQQSQRQQQQQLSVQRQPNTSYFENKNNVNHQRVGSIHNTPQNIVTNKDNTNLHKAVPADRIKNIPNLQSPISPQTTNSKRQNSSRFNNESVPQISQISSISRRQYTKINNKNSMSENPFSDIRGQSANNSTVNFYNQFIYKLEDSNAQQHNYAQLQSLSTKTKTTILNSQKQQQKLKYQGQNYGQAYVGVSTQDGTSTLQFLNDLKNFNASAGSPQRSPNYQTGYQDTKYESSLSNRYEATYNYQFYTKPSQGIYDYPKNTYQYQPVLTNRDVSPLGAFKEMEAASYNNDKKSQESSYRNYQNNQNLNVNNKDAIYYAQSFGINNSRGKTLQQNLQMKYSMTQDEEYHVKWDPEILADLQSIHH